MPYCCRCRRFIRTSFAEYAHQNAWCPSCRDVVPTSLCRTRMWVFFVILALTIETQVLTWF
jgi:hypothetical protein